MYFNAISLFDEIANAITLGEIKDFKKKVCTAKLLIIDDFGLGGFNQSLAPAFLEIIDKQSQSGGLLITSQVPKNYGLSSFKTLPLQMQSWIGFYIDLMNLRF